LLARDLSLFDPARGGYVTLRAHRTDQPRRGSRRIRFTPWLWMRAARDDKNARENFRSPEAPHDAS